MTIKAKHAYGTVLGDFLAKRRDEIASKMAGAEAKAEDLEAARTAVAEELCAAAGLGADDYMAIESGAKDPTPEQCDQLASVLATHDVTVTGDDLRALMDETPEEPAAREEDAALRAATEAALTFEEAAKVAALAAEAAVQETTRVHAENETLRTKCSTLEAQITKDAALVKAGQQFRDAKASELTRRISLRHGDAAKIPATVTEAIGNASLEQLELMAAVQGPDPLSTPLCSDCGKKAAAAYRSSTEPKDAPPPVPGVEVPSVGVTTHERYRAARKVQEQHEFAGKPLRFEEALAALAKNTDEEILALL